MNLGYVTAKQVATAKEAATDCGVGVVNWMLVHEILRPADITQALAAHFGAEVVNLEVVKINKKIIATVPRIIAFKYRIIPVAKHCDGITIAIADPSDLATVDSLGHLLKAIIILQVASEANIEAALSKYYGK